MRCARFAPVFALLIGLSSAQQAGETGDNVEVPPPMAIGRCTKASGCKIEDANATLDANWRWIYAVQCQGSGPCYSAGNCFTSDAWDSSHCMDGKACAAKCALGGVNAKKYISTYGVKPIPGGLELKFVTGQNIGSRLYLSQGTGYMPFKLKNREFTFDVDASALPCGLNGAVYFVEMRADGRKGGSNLAGARFGTGYCDAQCPQDVKFIDGEANIEGWNTKRPHGDMGACCAEMDVWEANSAASAYTAHPCSVDGMVVCQGLKCGEKHERYRGVCDKDGCDYNSYRLGSRHFLGAGQDFAVDTSRPITVITQFLTSDGTDTGDLTEIRRLYMQNGKVLKNSGATILGSSAGNSLTDGLCKAQKSVFGDPNDFAAKGGLKQMGEALDRGMVLVLSLWDDKLTHMKWLDSRSGKGDESSSGVARGPCAPSDGRPEVLRSQHGDASVKYTNFMYGEIDSTYLVKSYVKPDHVAKDRKSYYAKRLSRYASGIIPQAGSASMPSAPASWSPASQSVKRAGRSKTTSRLCGKEYDLCSSGRTGPKCCNAGCTCQPRFWSTSQCIPDSGRQDCPGPAQALHMGNHSFTHVPSRVSPEGSIFSGWVFFFLAIQTCCVCILAPYMWRKARQALKIGKNGGLRPSIATATEGNDEPALRQHPPTDSMIANTGGGLQDSPVNPGPQKQSRSSWLFRRDRSPTRADGH